MVRIFLSLTLLLCAVIAYLYAFGQVNRFNRSALFEVLALRCEGDRFCLSAAYHQCISDYFDRISEDQLRSCLMAMEYEKEL